MTRWTVAAAILAALAVCAAASAASEAATGTRCAVSGGSTWTPPINVSSIRPGAVSLAGTLTCHGGGVAVGVLAGFTRSPKLACVAPPATTPEAGVLTIFWNTGKSSRIAVKVTFVNSTGHQTLTGKVSSGLFAGDPVKLDIQARPGVGQCTDASPLVSNTWSGTITL